MLVEASETRGVLERLLSLRMLLTWYALKFWGSFLAQETETVEGLRFKVLFDQNMNQYIKRMD